MDDGHLDVICHECLGHPGCRCQGATITQKGLDTAMLPRYDRESHGGACLIYGNPMEILWTPPENLEIPWKSWMFGILWYDDLLIFRFSDHL